MKRHDTWTNYNETGTWRKMDRMRRKGSDSKKQSDRRKNTWFFPPYTSEWPENECRTEKLWNKALKNKNQGRDDRWMSYEDGLEL